MKVVFVGVFYYGGPVRNLYTIFQTYKKIAKVFETNGIECLFFSKQNEVLPQDKTLDEAQFNKILPEVDLLFMWNGSLGKEVEIAEKCRKQGTPVRFMELGWLPQTNTFYFDPEGVNYASTMTDWDYKGITEEDADFARTKLAFYHLSVAKFTGIKEEDFVFVPFQVEGDSQIIRYSPRIKKMQQLIDYVTAFVPGKIIFKRHPKDDPGELKFPDRCKVYNSGTTHDFLTQCKYVVTINSTVGVEALSYNLPVITLGHAFYGGKGLTYQVDDDSRMKLAVEWAESNKVAIGRIQAFMCYLFKKQWHKQELENPEKVITLIDGLTE
jgi:capsule polysaccharide export protein KpsC/LpsZ